MNAYQERQETRETRTATKARRKNSKKQDARGNTEEQQHAQGKKQGKQGKEEARGTRDDNNAPEAERNPQAILTLVLPVKVSWSCLLGRPLSRAGFASLGAALGGENKEEAPNP